MLSRSLNGIKNFFTPKDTFNNDESILRHQIFALLTISFCFALGVLPFSFVRLQEGNFIVGISQLLLSLFLLHGYYKLRKDKWNDPYNLDTF